MDDQPRGALDGVAPDVDGRGIDASGDLPLLFPEQASAPDPVELTELVFVGGQQVYRFSLEALPAVAFEASIVSNAHGHRVTVHRLGHSEADTVDTIVLPSEMFPTPASADGPALRWAVVVATRTIGRWDGAAPAVSTDRVALAIEPDPDSQALGQANVKRVRRAFSRARQDAGVGSEVFKFTMASDGSVWIRTGRGHLMPSQIDRLLDGLESRIGDIPIVVVDAEFRAYRLPRQAHETHHPAHAALRRVEEAFEQAKEAFRDQHDERGHQIYVGLQRLRCNPRGEIVGHASGIQHEPVVTFLEQRLTGLKLELRRMRFDYVLRLPRV